TLLMRSNEGGGGSSTTDFDSSEGTVAPKLTIFFDAPPATPSSGEMPLFIQGQPSGSLDLSIGDKFTISSELFIHGHQPIPTNNAKIIWTDYNDDIGFKFWLDIAVWDSDTVKIRLVIPDTLEVCER
ncbi:hypothetical protein LCGC14_2564280, partial [marine sediment metagenome]